MDGKLENGAEIPSKIIAVFRGKYLTIEIKFEKPYLLCVCCAFYRFFEFLEAVVGDFLFNGRSNVQRTDNR